MPAFLSLAIRTASRLVRVIVPIAIAGACLWLVSLRLDWLPKPDKRGQSQHNRNCELAQP